MSEWDKAPAVATLDAPEPSAPSWKSAPAVSAWQSAPPIASSWKDAPPVSSAPAPLGLVNDNPLSVHAETRGETQPERTDSPLHPQAPQGAIGNAVNAAVGTTIEPLSNIAIRGLGDVGAISPQTEQQAVEYEPVPHDLSRPSGMLGAAGGQAAEATALSLTGLGAAVPYVFAAQGAENAADRIQSREARGEKISGAGRFANIAGETALNYGVGRLAPGQAANQAIIQSVAPVLENAGLNAAKNIGISAGVHGIEGAAQQGASNALTKFTGVDPNQSLTEGMGEASAQGAVFGGVGQGVHEAVGAWQKAPPVHPHEQAAAHMEEAARLLRENVPKSAVQKDLFGKSFIPSSGVGDQQPMFHEPVKVEPPASEKIKASASATDEANTPTFDKLPPRRGAASIPGKKELADALYGPESFVKQDVIPAAKSTGKLLADTADAVRRVFAPQTRGDDARLAAGMAREHGAELAQRGDRAEMQLRTARKFFDGQDAKSNLAFMDAVEHGAEHPNPVLRQAAKAMREILDTKRAEVTALGKGKLEHFIQDYFPHIWKDPEKAAQVMGSILGKRPLEGTKGFLKKRSIPTIAEGVEKELEPISDNPVDLVLLKAREMDRYILGQKMLGEMKEKGLAKFVSVNDHAPEGYAKLDDKIAQVYGPPTIGVNEYTDTLAYDGLQKFADDLGIEHERKMKLPGGILGDASPTGRDVRTRFSTGYQTLAHEIGHALDFRFGLGKALFEHPDNATRRSLKQELRALADQRGATLENPAGERSTYRRKRVEQIANVLDAYVHMPDQMQQTAPTVYAEFRKFLSSRPELEQINNIKRSTSRKAMGGEVAHGGLLKMGEYYAPEQAAQVLNNYLSPGLRNKSGAFRAYLGAANVMNQAQLGYSGFHLGFTTLDSAVSRLSLGIQQGMRLHPVEAAKSIASVPVAPITNLLQGSKVLREWYKPGSEGGDIGKIVDGMKAAGGRARMDAFYRTEVTRNMVKAFKQGNITGGVLRAPFALTEQIAKPIMEYIVPRQKMGVFADMARMELDKLGPDANRDQVREAMGKAWDSADNRMGQLVYDNLFWNKTAKDLGMASVRSLGWNIGTFRELGGGLTDFAKAAGNAARLRKPEVTSRMAYTVALPMLVGAIGGMAHYLMNGKGPEELKDYFYPKTGKKDADGHDIRLALPSYMKDVYAVAHQPGTTISHKLHPALSAISDMLNNEDYYGVKIRNEDDPLVKQAMDTLKFAGKQMEPFAIRGARKAAEDRQSLGAKALPFIGVTQAPVYISNTPAEKEAGRLMADQMPRGSRTQEEYDRSRMVRDLANKVRAGDPDANEAINRARAGGVLRPPDVQKIQSRAKLSTLQYHVKGLGAEQAMKVWALADDKEKAAMLPEMHAKSLDSKTMPDADQKKMRGELLATADKADPDRARRMRFDYEYSDLTERASGREKYVKLMHQATEANRMKNPEKAAELRIDAKAALASASMQPADRSRLARMKFVHERLSKLDADAKAGIITEAEASQRAQKFLGMVPAKKAA